MASMSDSTVAFTAAANVLLRKMQIILSGKPNPCNTISRAFKEGLSAVDSKASVTFL